MIKEQKIMEETEIIIKTYYCDACGDEIEKGKVHKCEKCGKHICHKCIEHEECFGDYPETYCQKCWNIGRPFRDFIYLLENKINELNNEWENECRK